MSRGQPWLSYLQVSWRVTSRLENGGGVKTVEDQPYSENGKCAQRFQSHECTYREEKDGRWLSDLRMFLKYLGKFKNSCE